MPLDLFDEAGIAVRLQAVAEAAAGVQLAIGLNIGDVLQLAGNDPRLRGVPVELLKIVLDGVFDPGRCDGEGSRGRDGLRQYRCHGQPGRPRSSEPRFYHRC